MAADEIPLFFYAAAPLTAKSRTQTALICAVRQNAFIALARNASDLLG
jgi:hypothetical protein